MKRLAVAALLVLISGVIVWTPAQAVPPGCTEIGTDREDALAGTPRVDKLCALGGDDWSHGANGNDSILGGSGSDTLVGGPGRDAIRGGPGDDRLISVDSHSTDRLKGGAGFDRCYADRGERIRGCEEVNRVGTSAAVEATIQALTTAFLGATRLAEEAQEEVVSLQIIIDSLPPNPACPSPAMSPPPCP